MTYLEGVEIIHKIEREYDVMSIRYKGMRVWSYLRLYLLDRITANRENKLSKSTVMLVLKCLFAYNPFRMFKRYDNWIFTACERRKRLGDKMVQRVSGGISTNVDKCLMIEKPNKVIGHYPFSEINEKNIVSESWLLMVTHLIEHMSRPFACKIENEEILKRIIKEYSFDFNYKHNIKLLDAQRRAVRFLLAIVPKPKRVLMESPYDSMGYMWAFHQAGVKVIELQHGVLNSTHNAYNAIAYENNMNPDCICVFGEEEYKYFTQDKPQYAPKVMMTGLYMLELAEQFFNVDIFASHRNQYKNIIVAAGQADAEQELSAFVDVVAQKRKDILFVYIPRLRDADIKFSSENVVLKKDVNIYEYLKWADVHLTVSSTTCLESHYFHTPTIFFNLNNKAKLYYGHVLHDENGTAYVEQTNQFDAALETLLGQQTEWKELFAHNHIEKIKALLNEN